MTPFELDLLTTVWPWLWTVMVGLVGFLVTLYVRTFILHLDTRLSNLSETLQKFGDDLKKAEQQITSSREETRHRLDRLIGDSDARIGRIEAVCETQHGIAMNRRASDRQINWAHESDVSGDRVKRSP